MPNLVRAALVQAKWTGDSGSMTDLHERQARHAAGQGAKIIGFQEVFNAPYFCQVQDTEHCRWAEEVPGGPTTRRMRAVASELGLVLTVFAQVAAVGIDDRRGVVVEPRTVHLENGQNDDQAEFTGALLMTYPESGQLVALAEAATATTEELVRRGHRAGVLRRDFTAGDLYYADVANGLALRNLPTPSRADYDRRSRFFLDSLRAH